MNNEDGLNIVLDEVRKQYADAKVLDDFSVGYDFKQDCSSNYIEFSSFCRLDEKTIRFQTRKSLDKPPA